VLDDVERAIDKCNNLVKENGTLLLRAALVEACGDLERCENDRAELDLEVGRLNVKLASTVDVSWVGA
jgi:hypothetical protein